MKKEKLVTVFTFLAVSVVVSATTAIITSKSVERNNPVQTAQPVPSQFASMNNATYAPTDFTLAAEKSVNSVVHVKTKYQVESARYSGDPLFDFFFGRPDRGFQQPQEQIGTGSGVIISSDGYIVTNNHVIDQAKGIEVTLNDKRTFKASVVGVDLTTDIALIKIDATNLPTIAFGNSDNLKVGEWVLAVGNPFNLTSTVTAGIVSAKARNINILNSAMKIESFIQTDAAVNPGNSGGALVNTRGELIGINTAIASQTGSYTGYSFAVPVSIVSKVVGDLKEYGIVQRAILGVEIMDISDEFAKEKKLSTLDGVYVGKVVENGSAKAAGIKDGDIITAVNNVKVNSVAELQEQVGRFRPGDKITVTVNRNGDNKEISVQLKNRSGSTSVVKAVDLSGLGAKFTPISDELKYKYQTSYGIEVTNVIKGGKFEKAGIQRGYIILKINNSSVKTEEDIESLLESALGNERAEKALFISGFYPNGKISHYAVDLNE